MTLTRRSLTMHRTLGRLGALAVLTLGEPRALAQIAVPDAVGLTGFIHTAGGQPYEGTATLDIRLYSAQWGGTQLLTESFLETPVVGSRFAVEVGSGASFPTGALSSIGELFALYDEVWVAVAINGNAELPRQRFVSSVYSLRSQLAQVAWAVDCEGCIDEPHLATGSVTAAKLGEQCAPGQVLKSIGTGLWACGADADTTYSAGDGIKVSSGAIAIASGGCQPGEVLKRNAGNTAWECSTDTTNSAELGGGLDLSGTAFAIAAGGVSSERIADGSIELVDLSDAAKAQLSNLLVLNRNPGFEAGLQGWKDAPGTNVSGVLETDPGEVHRGASAVRLVSNAASDVSLLAGDELYPVLPDTFLMLRFWAKRLFYQQFTGLEPAKLEVRFYDAAMAETGLPLEVPFADGTDAAYVPYEVSGTVPVDASWVAISSFGPGSGHIGTFYFDDVELLTASPATTELFVRRSGGSFTGDVGVQADLAVSGNALLTGSLGVGGDVSLGADLHVTGDLIGLGLTVNGPVAGTGFAGWDMSDANDLTTTTAFGGDLSGGYSSLQVSDDSHSHGDSTVSDQISISNTRLYAPAGAGNVGIGTDSPNARLDVAGNALVTGSLGVGGDVSLGADLHVTGDLIGLGLTVNGPVAGTGFAGWDMSDANDLTTTTAFGGDLSGGYSSLQVSDDSHSHGDSTVSDQISISNTRLYAPAGAGNVGIGTDSPNARLDVAGTSQAVPGIRITNTDTAELTYSLRLEGASTTERAIGFFTDSTLEWWLGRDNVGLINAGIGFWRPGLGWGLTLRDTGQVGIGTDNPLEKLSVQGNIAMTGQPIFDLEVVERTDPRLTFTPAVFDCTPGAWCNGGQNWGNNRFANHSYYTLCDHDQDCGSNTVTLALDKNPYRTVLFSHLDWSVCRYFDVHVSFDGGTSYSFHKRVSTYRTVTQGPYVSQVRTLVSNLPLGGDVRVRLVAARGRLHFEGFALARFVLPDEVHNALPIVGRWGATNGGSGSGTYYEWGSEHRNTSPAHFTRVALGSQANAAIRVLQEGYYSIMANVLQANLSNDVRGDVYLYRNGSSIEHSLGTGHLGQEYYKHVLTTVEFFSAGDTISVYNHVGNVYGYDNQWSNMAIHLVR
jgi:hypothetical protein